MIGQSKNVIGAYLIIFCKADQEFVCQRLHASLNIAVFPLCDANTLCNLLLGEIVIFTQIFYPVLQFDHLPNPNLISQYEIYNR